MRTWKEVEAALREIRQLNAREGRIVERARKIQQACKARRGQIEERIENFTRAHEADMGGKRSMDLACGRVWLRQATHLAIRHLGKALAWLQEQGRHECVRVKHEINKEALEQADPDVLAACGARLKTEDRFGYEVW